MCPDPPRVRAHLSKSLAGGCKAAHTNKATSRQMTEPEKKTVLHVRADEEEDRSEFLDNMVELAQELDDEIIIGNYKHLEFILDANRPHSFRSKVPFEERN